MHETSDFFYSIITFSYTEYFVHSYTVDVVLIFSNMQYGPFSELEDGGSNAYSSSNFVHKLYWTIRRVASINKN